MIGTFTKHSVWMLLSQALILAVGLVSSVIIARVLHPEGRGLYALAALLPAFLVTFVDVGVGGASIFHIGAHKYRSDVVFGNNLLLVAAHSVLAVLVGLLLIHVARDGLFPGVKPGYLLLALLIIPGQLCLSFILPLLLGLHRIQAYNVFQVLRATLLLGLAVICLIPLRGGVAGALIAEAVGSLLTCAALFFAVRSQTHGVRLRFDKGYVKDTYVYGIKLYVSALLFLLNGRLNFVLINAYLSPLMVGLFSVSVGLSEKLWLVADAVGTVLFPKVAAEPDSARRNAFTALVFRSVLVGVVALSMLLWIVGDLLVVLLYSDRFAGAARPFRILLIGAVASCGWRILQADLMGRGRPGGMALVMGVAFVANLVLSVLLIPAYGLDGAAWAVSLAATAALIAGVIIFVRASGGTITALLLPRRSDLTAYRALVSFLVTTVRPGSLGK